MTHVTCHVTSTRSEEHTSELQSHVNLVCRLLLEKKKYALIRVGEDGWTGAATLGLFGLGAAAFAAFVLVELRSPHPMLDLSLFRSRTFVGVMAGALLLSGAAFSHLMYVSLWLQSAEGMCPVSAGLVLVPLSISAFAVSAVAGRLLHGALSLQSIGGRRVLHSFPTRRSSD